MSPEVPKRKPDNGSRDDLRAEFLRNKPQQSGANATENNQAQANTKVENNEDRRASGAQNEEYQQLDMFQEAGIKVEAQKENIKYITQYNRRGEMLDRASKALENQDLETLPQQQIKILQENLPGFIEDANSKIQELREKPGMNERIKALEDLRDKAIVFNQQLGVFQEAGNEGEDTQNPNTQETTGGSKPASIEGGKTQIEEKAPREPKVESIGRDTSKLEKYKSFEQIAQKLKEKIGQLQELINQIENGNLDEDKQAEIENQISNVAFEIEDLKNQLIEQPDDLISEELERARKLRKEIERLQSESESEANATDNSQRDAQIQQLTEELDEVEGTIVNNGNFLYELDSTINTAYTMKEPKKLSLATKDRVAQVMTDTGNDFREKFQLAIELNRRGRSLR